MIRMSNCPTAIVILDHNRWSNLHRQHIHSINPSKSPSKPKKKPGGPLKSGKEMEKQQKNTSEKWKKKTFFSEYSPSSIQEKRSTPDHHRSRCFGIRALTRRATVSWFRSVTVVWPLGSRPLAEILQVHMDDYSGIHGNVVVHNGNVVVHYGNIMVHNGNIVVDNGNMGGFHKWGVPLVIIHFCEMFPF